MLVESAIDFPVELLVFSLFLGKVDEKATQLHAIASLKVLLDATKPQNGAATSSAANHLNAVKQETMLVPSCVPDMPNGVASTLADVNLDAVSCICFYPRPRAPLEFDTNILKLRVGKYLFV